MRNMENAGGRAGVSGDCSHSRIRSPEHNPGGCRVQVAPPQVPPHPLGCLARLVPEVVHAVSPLTLPAPPMQDGDR